jgi:signal peptidase I
MMSESQAFPRRSAAITIGLATTLALAALFLLAGLWNPVAGLPLAAIFLIAAYGIHRRRAWSAYGGALLLASMAAIAAIRAPHLPVAGIVTSAGIIGIAAFALFYAGRRMPAGAAPGSRSGWIALALAAFAFPQFCGAYVIATGSMSDTILKGDQILVLPLTGAPSRGEVIQFRYPPDPKQMFIKRIAAVGGDRVHLRNKQLFVNGTAVNEPYAIHSTGYIDDFRDNFPASPSTPLPAAWAEELRAHTVNGEFVVPAGKFFVLGDNRDDSLDSRYFGLLERGDLAGKPALIYFSAADTKAPVLLHPSQIRWGRLFKGL